MKLSRVLAASVLAVACFAMAAIASAEGIAVGNSTLIGALDYSDTFTTAANDGNAARIDGQWPYANVPAVAQVENNYGNPIRSWGYSYSPSPDYAPQGVTQFGSINKDSDVSGGTYGYALSGGSGAGSATGMTQAGSADLGLYYLDFGIDYNLRNTFVVQTDAVSTADRFEITIGNENNTIFSAHGLSVFFRAPGIERSDLIGLYNVGVGETLASFSSGLSQVRDWANLAVKFDLDNGLLDMYTGQALRGQINLKTFANGAYWNVVDASTNDYVSIGGGGLDDRLWTDNFQVGAPVPEPSVILLLATGIVGLLAYAWRRRK